MGFQLVVVRGRSAAVAHRLGPGTTTAGRQEGCQLLIKSSRVSRRHCEFVEKKGRLFVKDLGSVNGTLVNGRRVEGQQALAVGDELSLGGIVLRVESTSGAAAVPVPASPGDTAVSQAAAASDEIFLEEEENQAGAIPVDDTVEEVGLLAPAAGQPAASANSARSTAGTKKPPPAAKSAELGEEAVADFLLKIDLDEAT